jgi:hypothetical protein
VERKLSWHTFRHYRGTVLGKLNKTKKKLMTVGAPTDIRTGHPLLKSQKCDHFIQLSLYRLLLLQYLHILVSIPGEVRIESLCTIKINLSY